MAGKNTAAFGIYSDKATAQTAVDQLLAGGFSNDDVSVLMSDVQSSRDFAAEKNTKAPEGTTTGVSVGGVVGGTLGLLAGIGALAIPGVKPIIATSPIMGALAGLGVGGAVGGLVGALVGLGIPEYEAKRYEGRVKEGGISSLSIALLQRKFPEQSRSSRPLAQRTSLLRERALMESTPRIQPM